MVKYKLSYFKLQGRAEGIKYIFAVGKVPFEDHRIEFQDWSSLKPNSVIGSLPELEIDGGQRISQSMAIGRYVAKVTKLYGSNLLEEAQIDMIAETANEIREKCVPIYFNHVPKDGIVTSCQKLLAFLSKILGENEYFVGNKISWADTHFFHCMELTMQAMEITEMLDGLDNLQKLKDRVGQNPQIVEYCKKRPDFSMLVPRPPKP